MRKLGCILAVAAFLSGATLALADRPQGLMWNRSGLPATIPLQIKTDSGGDTVVYLIDLTSGDKVLAAYARGGEFFRVLVPPGRFGLLFAHGAEWQDEDTLFGLDTRVFALDEALVFSVGVGHRRGHIVDLRMLDAPSVKGLSECQRWALDPDSLQVPRAPGLEGSEKNRGVAPRPEKLSAPRYDVRSVFCD
ncbi:hypothetical protein BXY66_0601 [Shimia isoporae]|uniref:Uncharacterized protein n=1 Tax=Shimia isoporae TaxID=647720 RepID=A0A4R1NK29_9RHOB|nr:hypothetical protein [Shimia isoporae]TCL08564.1 hypothetical protein BXY66_0601 [Shimia isoporae]